MSPPGVSSSDATSVRISSTVERLHSPQTTTMVPLFLVFNVRFAVWLIFHLYEVRACLTSMSTPAIRADRNEHLRTPWIQFIIANAPQVVVPALLHSALRLQLL